MSDDLPPNDLPSDEYPYGVDTIRLRISWPAAPASRGYNGRKWSMRPLRGQTGGARQDAPGADAVTANRDGLAVTSPGHVPVFPEQGQAVPANQAIEKGGPASELLAAFRALRAGAPQDRGPTAKEAAAPGTAGRDGNGPGSAPPITIAASLPLGGRSTNAPASGDAGSTTGRLGTVRPNYASQLGDLSMRHETGYSPGHEGKAAGVVSRGARIPAGCRMAPTSSPVPRPVVDRCRRS